VDSTELTTPEWDELLCEAWRLGVAVQFHRRLLTEAPVRPIPRGVLQCIWLGAVQQRRAAADRQRELAAVLGCLRGVSVTPILLKGAHLASTVYGEPALRPMADLDLLLHPPELERAERALCAVGYSSTRVEPVADVCTTDHQLPILTKDGGYPIELHWTPVALSIGARLDLEDLWSRAQPVTVDGEPALVLAPEDALLHICVHGGLQSLFDHGLRPLLDVAAILDRHGATFDWSTVEYRAHDWGIARSVYLVLELARSDVGVPVPASTLDRLQPGGVPPPVIAAARAQVFESRVPSLAHADTQAVTLACLRPRLMLQRAFRSQANLPKRTSTPRHGGNTAFRRLARVHRLVVKYGGGFWHSLGGDPRNLGALARKIRREMILQAWLGRVRA
jgi:hypothetical protein